MRRVRRRDRRMWFFALAIFVAVFLFSFLTQKFKSSDEEVEAASLANFDPGYIISDWQMGNYTSMSEAEIQAFLTKKNPCSNRDYAYYQQLSAWNPGVIWHFENGHFICLSEERFGDGEKIGSGETAAHIIWRAAQDYKINPQVLIVLLQKESSLITDPIPNNYDYRSATGYGCPDTAPCSSEYYGFKNQVRKAAALFSTVLNGGWTNYPLGNNYVQYNPNPGCGGTVVNIRSLATSALYRYTPYQPNAGAIAAGYGTAACGAYGNRNFYLYFEDWFGGVTNTADTYELEKDNVSEVIKNKFQQKYDSVKEKIGEPASRMNCNIGHEGACVKAYTNGVIIYNEKTGIWENYGEIRKRFTQLGSVDGQLGFPLGPMNCSIGHEGACVQAYEGGVIISGAETGAWESYGEMRTRHTRNGSVDGYFGFPISGVVDDGTVAYQAFERGTILKDINGKYWVTTKEVAERYAEVYEILGGAVANVNRWIGYEGACVQSFENGVIIYGVETGAWESYGTAREKHVGAGSINGELGFPVSGVEIVNGVEKQKFEGGEV